MKFLFYKSNHRIQEYTEYKSCLVSVIWGGLLGCGGAVQQTAVRWFVTARTVPRGARFIARFNARFGERFNARFGTDRGSRA